MLGFMHGIGLITLRQFTMYQALHRPKQIYSLACAVLPGSVLLQCAANGDLESVEQMRRILGLPIAMLWLFRIIRFCSYNVVLSIQLCVTVATLLSNTHCGCDQRTHAKYQRARTTCENPQMYTKIPN